MATVLEVKLSRAHRDALQTELTLRIYERGDAIGTPPNVTYPRTFLAELLWHFRDPAPTLQVVGQRARTELRMLCDQWHLNFAEANWVVPTRLPW